MDLLRRSFFFLLCSLFLGMTAPPHVRAAADPVEIAVSGVEEDLETNVRAALSLPPGLVRDGKVDRHWLERFRRRIPEHVRSALEPFGYYSPEVTVSAEETGRESLLLRVEIEPGEPVRVTRVRVGVEGEGASRDDLRELTAEFPLGRGDILRHDLYEDAKGRLKSRALDLGFLDADFTEHEIRVHRGEKWAEITLVLDTGRRYRFGEVRIEGGEDYPPRFLQRYLSFKRGDVFSFARLGETQLNYLNSERFKEVVVTPHEEEAEDDQVPVTVQLVPAPSRRLRPGIGYATDTGPRFTLRYRDLNVRSRGHELQGEFLIAQLKQSLGTAYIVPSRRNIDSHTAYRVGYDQEDLDTYDNRIFFAEAERVRVYPRGWKRSAYLRLQHDDFTIGENEATSRIVLPGVRLSRRRYRDVVRPEEGYSFALEARGTHKTLLSDTDLAQLLASGNTLIPLPARFSLFIRAQAGITLQSDPLSDIPPSLRFFAGGDQSVRGYGYRTLGPRDDKGDVTGGKNLLVGSLELERALGENWGVAVFWDAGNAFNSFSDYALRHGAGLGVRWYTPVGPLRVDLARQFRVEDPGYHLHVSIGFGW